ncbi:MAG: hypothetical protein RI988_226 [Pseudomonadota bacterium]
MYPSRHRSFSGPLALVYGALIGYASLYPFEGWRWPPGAAWHDLLRLPWLPPQGSFDEISNGLGYLPLGLLLAVWASRQGLPALAAFAVAVAAPGCISFTLEAAQHLLPGRVPSARDWALNTAGAAAGAAVGVLLVAAGALRHWERWRTRWFEPDSAGAVVLLVAWPLGLLYPAPVALGMGDVFDAVARTLQAAQGGLGWPAPALAGPSSRPGTATALGPIAEGACIALGMLAPMLLALSVTRARTRRIVVVVGAVPVAAAAMALSTALNFGPQNAWAWVTPAAVPALGTAAVAGLAASLAAPRAAAALGLAALAALVALVSQAPSDPYYAASLQAWEQGQFIRFHGLSQWIGWLWPYAAMLWLTLRLARPPRRG